jgi:hypothetical protein
MWLRGKDGAKGQEIKSVAVTDVQSLRDSEGIVGYLRVTKMQPRGWEESGEGWCLGIVN